MQVKVIEVKVIQVKVIQIKVIQVKETKDVELIVNKSLVSTTVDLAGFPYAPII